MPFMMDPIDESYRTHLDAKPATNTTGSALPGAGALYEQQFGRAYQPATLDAAREKLDRALGIGAVDAHRAMHTEPVARAIYDAATRAIADAMHSSRDTNNVG